MYIAKIPNRSSPPAYLLRESYREDGKVKTRTICNVTHWSPEERAAFLQALKIKSSEFIPGKGIEITTSLPHGHVAAVLGTIRNLGLDKMVANGKSREREIVLGMITARILFPNSKLATTRYFRKDTANSSLGETLGIQEVTEDDLYRAMDWLLEKQVDIEKKLAAKHLQEGTLALYDLTSIYLEGRQCDLGKIGYSRDGKKGYPQIMVGLLCDSEGRPISVEVFPGNTGDASTLFQQVQKIRENFQLNRVVMVGDRGTITAARIEQDLKKIPGVDWITALKSVQVKGLLKGNGFQLTLFDEMEIGEIQSPDYPGERLVVCRNPALAEERGRKREELLRATEGVLVRIQEATKREKAPLRGQDKIALRVGRAINRFKMGKHFILDIQDRKFQFTRDYQGILEESHLDGIYVIRTSLTEKEMSAAECVLSYKKLSRVERAFRSLKSVVENIRPLYHFRESRVRSHVFLCMLGYYVEWHMRKALAPILFEDHAKEDAEKERTNPVEPAKVSAKARKKIKSRVTEEGLPINSFHGLLAHLATLTQNKMKLGTGKTMALSAATTMQRKTFQLLEVKVGA